MKYAFVAWGIFYFVSLAPVAFAQDPFAAGVRPTDPLTPEEEQKAFQLPPGFEIQLVAAEPEIQKPLNMAFDARGRLWVTDTVEYPYPAPPDRPGRDTIKVLEDADGDGRAERVTTFAEGLNIPIGLYPYKNGVIAYSIPNIYFFEDTDGDGRSDKQTKLFGPFDYSRDTHGMQNAFRRGFDGWLYACHGFNNNSTVSGGDGHTIAMQSGNTYRMRLDGSRIEQFTWGQVNPFGMTQDPLGNLFTADCHSKPVYQLLRGGYYPSFGKPHDGLGFVPPMMDHLHGSTAIAGVVYYADDRFPPEYRGNLFSGNVMTSRVNRNSLVYSGSTIACREESDLVATTDPWFRPVDIQLAPDGSLYIADFYNRIIGHYEVPLDHPGRDRTSGRIWRLTYKGDGANESPRERVDLTQADVAGLTAALESSNLTQRLLATNELADRLGVDAAPALKQLFAASGKPETRTHALWALERLGALDDNLLAKAVQDQDRTMRVHTMRLLSERPDWSPENRQWVLAGLADRDAFVQRAAADALGQHPRFDQVQPLMKLALTASEADVLLRHTARMALRNHLRDDSSAEKLSTLALDERESKMLADVLVAVPSSQAATWLVDHVQQQRAEPGKLRTYLEHASRYIQGDRIDALVTIARTSFGGDLEMQHDLLRALRDGLAQRGVAAPDSVRQWALELADAFLDSAKRTTAAWVNMPHPEAKKHDNPWVLQKRVSADGDAESLFLCSLPRGEELTGILRSPEFVVPAKLSFYLAGHIGFPGAPVVAKNFIRLKDAETGEVLAESSPPRNDTAQRVEWDLASQAGRRGYLEIVDGDQRPAYAWMAVGRFEPQVVSLPDADPSQIAMRLRAAAELIGELKLSERAPHLVDILSRDQVDRAAQKAAAEALLILRPHPRLAALTQVLDDPSVSDGLRDLIISAIAKPNEESTQEAVDQAFQQLPQRLQAAIALSLATTKDGAETLLATIERGRASPRLLALNVIHSQLARHEISGLAERMKRLTSSLPPADETLLQLIAQRRERHQQFAVSLEHGAQVFQKHCASCHQISGKGAMIGPQLDGIGNRGLERVLEDVLAPNQNVDVAFRASTFALSDGRVLSGLVRRQEGEILIVANNKGEEVKISQSDIDEQAKTNLSLMPENVAELVPEEDFHHLIGYLLSLRGETEAPPAAADSGKAP